jgi:hypothetical protein
MKSKFILFFFCLIFISCKNQTVSPAANEIFVNQSTQVDKQKDLSTFFNVSLNPTIKFGFSTKVNRNSVKDNIILMDDKLNVAVSLNYSFEKNDSVVVMQPQNSLKPFQKYSARVYSNLLSNSNKKFNNDQLLKIITQLDSSDKLARISDDKLMDLVQKQTFTYFWDFGHPVSGLSRERNSSGDIVTSGGSGFGIMAIVVASERQFITRKAAVDRLLKMTDFLLTKAERFHGAFPHWLNGNSGKTVAFSQKDNGADLVETSYLFQGLLTARQYFNRENDPSEKLLTKQINQLWESVEWSWFRKNNEDKLYWHWSPNYAWDMNMPIKGWNECMITYILAASSPTFDIPKSVYTKGWANEGSFKNGKSYYGIKLPLGPDKGGPLFFSHYSFLGLDPRGLEDEYANYWDQNVAHSKINYNYCVANPKGFLGYGANCWGLTASDIQNGYTANEPNNDNGTISPTAALSSIVYTPLESLNALRFFYYKLGDKTWGNYGFIDAFNLSNFWFADSYLAIDQGPIIVMMENYRSGLLWKNFMAAPEVKSGLNKLGFKSPYL